MTRITAPWLTHPGARDVMSAIGARGNQALYVGGCVRNTLMGLPATDIDIATDARPDEVAALAEAHGIKTIPTGIDHGTLTLVSHGEPYEVTTFRNDVSTDGRRATVAFSGDILDDARRRDFTMNAIYATVGGTIVDPLDGVQDALDRRVRFIGNADDRIAEDHLRILRFFRFNAIYGRSGQDMDGDGLNACRKGAKGLANISAERIGAEIRKILSVPDPFHAVSNMKMFGILDQILPGAEPYALPALMRTERIADLLPDPIRRLAALSPKEAVDSLRLSRNEAKYLAFLMDNMHGDDPIEVLGYRHGETAVDVLALRAAVKGSVLDSSAVFKAMQGAMKVFPISAQDLMPEFQGGALGAKLREVEDRWIASDFSLTKDDLLEYDESPSP